MVKQLLAIALISLAMIPFTAPFAACDAGSQFDASSSAVCNEAGPTSIDVDSVARVDAVFPNMRTGCPAIPSVPETSAVTSRTSDSLRPLSTLTNPSFFGFSPILRI
jgi:hypothetical protein